MKIIKISFHKVCRNILLLSKISIYYLFALKMYLLISNKINYRLKKFSFIYSTQLESEYSTGSHNQEKMDSTDQGVSVFSNMNTIALHELSIL